jgi:hypothetical protein
MKTYLRLLASTALILAGYCVFFALSRGNQVSFFVDPGGLDYQSYASMASSSLLHNEAQPPYDRRLLMPLLVKGLMLLGIPCANSFLLISFGASLAAAALCFRYLTLLGFREGVSFAGATLFTLCVGGFSTIRCYGVPDALLYLLILSALVSALSGWFWPTVLSLILLALAKPWTEVLLLPALLALSTRPWSWGRILVLVVIPLLTNFGVKFISAPKPHFSYLSAENLAAVYGHVDATSVGRFLKQCALGAGYSLGPLWLVALANVRKARSFSLTMLTYAVPFLAPLALATDTERMLSLFFPVVLPLCALALVQFENQPHRQSAAITVLMACTVGSQLTIYGRGGWRILVCLLLVLLPVLFVWYLGRGQAAPGSATEGELIKVKRVTTLRELITRIIPHKEAATRP